VVGSRGERSIRGGGNSYTVITLLDYDGRREQIDKLHTNILRKRYYRPRE
jgi:hypothetical protein